MSTTQPADSGSPAVRIAALTAGLYGVEIADLSTNHLLDRDLGVKSHQLTDLWAIFTSPLVHANWGHLIGNTLPLLIFGYLVLKSGWQEFLRVSVIGAACSGLAAWLLSASGTVTLGASGVIFALFTYLLARGVYTRSLGQILLAFLLIFLFGGLLFGAVPALAPPGVSWEAHLGGAIGGVIAARGLKARHERRAA